MLERTLSEDMTTFPAYHQTWRQKLSNAKTVTAVFHHHNREARRELKVYNNDKILPFFPIPTYLGVKMDRTLTYRHHLEALRKKLSTRVSLLTRLAGSGWGAGAKTLHTAAFLYYFAMTNEKRRNKITLRFHSANSRHCFSSFLFSFFA